MYASNKSEAKHKLRQEMISNIVLLMSGHPEHKKHLHQVSFYLGKALGEDGGDGVYHSIQSQLGFFKS